MERRNFYQDRLKMDQGIELGEGEDEQGGIHTRAA